MKWLPRAALLVALVGCGRSRSHQAAEDDPPAPPPLPPSVDARPGPDAAPGKTTKDGRCRQLPFAQELSVPEASGSDYFTVDGKPRILVISDSGNHGAWIEIDPDSGATLATGNLPLDGKASDDLEGLAITGGIAYAITSSGFVREFARAGDQWVLQRKAYPVGPGGDAATAMTCANPRAVNCGRNWEGLCLADPAPADGCAGYGVAKDDGDLVCMTLGADGKLAADPARKLHLADAGVLAGCEIAPDGEKMWVGANMFGANTVWSITDWRDPARAHVDHVGDFGPGFCESIAIGPGSIIYRFSDTGGAPSLVEKWGCR
jgi:hypothetical protein